MHASRSHTAGGAHAERAIGADIEVQAAIDALWRERFATLDPVAERARFLEQGEFLCLPDFVPLGWCQRALREVDDARATRSRLPFVRAAQHVGWRTLQARAPVCAALYRSRVFVDWMSALVGRPVQLKDPRDDHACATYEYEREGDGMRFHYDTCGCDDGASYTQLLSLCDRSTQRLVVDLHTRSRGTRPVQRLSLQTRPGTLVVFCGSKVWHGVSPLGRGERRVILSMSYATDPSMRPWRRVYEAVKDAVLYFGPSTLGSMWGTRRGGAR
jgi:hypothetical protein